MRFCYIVANPEDPACRIIYLFGNIDFKQLYKKFLRDVLSDMKVGESTVDMNDYSRKIIFVQFVKQFFIRRKTVQNTVKFALFQIFSPYTISTPNISVRDNLP